MARRGARLLFSPGRKRRPGCLLSIFSLVVVILAVVSLNALNNSYATLLKERISIVGLDRSFEGFRLLHISDLHGLRFGAGQERLREQLRLENYSAVCLSGDMVGASGDVGPLLELIDLFPKDVPVYFVAGDDDPPPMSGQGTQVKADYILRAEEAGAIYLDAPQQIARGERKLWFVPADLYTTDLEAAAFSLSARQAELQAGTADDTLGGSAQMQAVSYQLQVLQRTAQAKELMSPKDSYILLSHYPPDADLVSSLHKGQDALRTAVNFPGTVSLILAGHWNNGQWRLPLIGAVALPPGARDLQTWTRGGAVSGQALVHGVPMYVSPGLGAGSNYSYRPFRLFNRPQMTHLTLTSAAR